MFRINLHSVVDLITNSSTVIFTYSEGSVEACKELINEILKLLGEEGTSDDYFYLDVFSEGLEDFCFDEDYTSEYPELQALNELGYTELRTKIKEIIHEVLTEKLERPQWMIKREEQERNGYGCSSVLYIEPKYEKFEPLAEKLKTFLYSIDHESTYD